MSIDRLSNALKIALEVHSEQCDLGGSPYILHPLWVFQHCGWKRAPNIHDREVMACVAILHDTIEDAENVGKKPSQVARMIYEECGARVCAEVEMLTRWPGEDYLLAYIPRVSRSWITRSVKVADIQHNLDESRLPSGSMKTERRDRYIRAKEFLLDIESSTRCGQLPT